MRRDDDWFDINYLLAGNPRQQAAIMVKVALGLGMFGVLGLAGAAAGGILAFVAASYWQRSLRW